MNTNLEAYYRLHARFYDATRWSFLFGRAEIIRRITQDTKPARILEIGCGTGTNLLALHRAFPEARIHGYDISADMLKIARRKTAAAGDRIQIHHQPYNASVSRSVRRKPFDLILAAYCLSMINPGFESVLQSAFSDLSSQGRLAVVDFNATRHAWFQAWMRLNRVRMEAHLLPALSEYFRPLSCDVKRAYCGLWTYFCFLGQKKV